MHLGWTQSFRMVGLPYIPLFPIPIGDSHSISVFVDPIYDSLHNVAHPPEIALRPLHSNELVKHDRVDTNGTIRKEVYGYRYHFDISGYSPDTLEVVFLSNFLGCKLPLVTFVATRKMEYDPVKVPDN
jgi:hypothetical protein